MPLIYYQIYIMKFQLCLDIPVFVPETKHEKSSKILPKNSDLFFYGQITNHISLWFLTLSTSVFIDCVLLHFNYCFSS